MKIFLLKILFFLCGIAITMFIVNYRLNDTINDNYELQYDELIKCHKKAEYIIIGSSHASHGIRVSLMDTMGIKFYNFAFDGSNPEFYYYWYSNIFSKYYVKPKYFIIAVDWFMFDEEWMWRKYEQDSEYFPGKVFLTHLKEVTKYNVVKMTLNRFGFIKHKQIDDLKYLVVDKKDYYPFSVNDYDDGFTPYEIRAADKARLFGSNPLKSRVSEKQKSFFVKLLELLVRDNVKIIFINIPEYGNTKNEYMKIETYSYLNYLSEKYLIPFLNYNIDRRTFINNDKKYYSDWGHLNSFGSSEFTNILREDLQSIIEVEPILSSRY